MSLGGKSLAGSEKSIKTIGRIMKISKISIRVVNMVASFNLGHRIRLENMANDNLHKPMTQCFYDPTLFPGMKYRIGEGTVIMFWSGKGYVTGCKNIDAINEAVSSFISVANRYVIK